MIATPAINLSAARTSLVARPAAGCRLCRHLRAICRNYRVNIAADRRRVRFLLVPLLANRAERTATVRGFLFTGVFVVSGITFY